MTCDINGNTLQDVLQLLTQGEPDNRLAEALRLVLNTAMLLERQQFLGVEPYQRGQERQDQANGFKPKTLKTRLGALELAVPQTRSGGFYPASLEKGQRSERALKLALAEMYVQGVSTRRVAKITEELCGFEVSSAQVSQAAAELDSILEAWRARPLSLCPYLLLDARYESVRIDGVVREVAVLVAVGLSGVQLVTSDDHAGLKAARKAVFGGVAWQRCQFHLQQNAPSYVAKQEMKKQVASEIRAIFNAPDLMAAELLLKQMVARYEKTAPKLSAWLEENLFEGLTVFRFPEAHRRLLRTSNGLERVNKEIRRRTRVANLFPSEASCLRLVSAVLMEISEEWETGKLYLRLSS
jgi:putative transposase